MIWLLATVLLVVAAPIVLWPLLSHWQPEAEPAQTGAEEPELELEEIALDVASGRISEAEAAARRRELT